MFFRGHTTTNLDLNESMHTPRKGRPFATPSPTKTGRPQKRHKSDGTTPKILDLTDGEDSEEKNRRRVARKAYDEVHQIVGKQFNILGLYVQLSNAYLLNKSKSGAQKFGCLWYFSWLLKETYPGWVGDNDEVSVL